MDITAMAQRDLSRNGQAQANAWGSLRPRSVGAEESIEHPRQYLRRNSAAAVVNCDNEVLAIAWFSLDSHLSAGGPMLDGVVDQIPK